MEDRTLKKSTTRSISAIDARAAAAVFALILSGCATQAVDPARQQTIQAPDTGEAAPDEAANDPGGDSVTIDPNVVSYDDYHDPLMPLNRFVFGFNDVVSRYALVPLGKGYARVVPDVVDRRIDNFFDNAATPIYAVNHLLQANPKPSGRNFARFGINTTLGLLGIFDPAAAWFGLERDETDFAETLAHYDAGYGTYLVLPFFGPSDARNASARVVDYFLQPIPWVLDNPEGFLLLSYGFFHDFAQSAQDYEELMKQSDDPYIFMRNMYLQGVQRDAAYR